jgi:hypothetical protein
MGTGPAGPGLVRVCATLSPYYYRIEANFGKQLHPYYSSHPFATCYIHRFTNLYYTPHLKESEFVTDKEILSEYINQVLLIYTRTTSINRTPQYYYL